MGDGSPISIVASGSMQTVARHVFESLSEDRRIGRKFQYSEIGYTTFANGEIKPKSLESVRESKVFLFHPMQHPDPNTSLVQLLITIDALKRAAADDIILVVPYLSYQRQDRKDEGRTSISARVVADAIQMSGAVKRLMTIEAHADQIQGFYSIPFDALPGWVIHREHVRKNYTNLENLTVVSPDYGGVKRAREFARSLYEQMPVGFCDKRRSGTNHVSELHYVGPSLEGRDVIFYDDMIDTAGTTVKAVEAIRALGPTSIRFYAAHAVMSNQDRPAEEKLRNANVQTVVTNSIPQTQEYAQTHSDWLTTLPVEPLLSDAIGQSLITGGSISSLINKNGKSK